MASYRFLKPRPDESESQAAAIHVAYHRASPGLTVVQLTAKEMAVLSRLLDQGLALEESARDAWVESLVDPFPGAKATLHSMLAESARAHAKVLDTLPKIPLPPTGGGAPPIDTSPLQTGARVGNYRLMHEIGHGGMSTVWLAMRTDELLTRPVALKLPHMHLQKAALADRFARERDILANLTHPNIARLYDAGVSTLGQPYLAMEYVAGESLAEYCRSRGLNVNVRVELFLQVLAAVQYDRALDTRDVSTMDFLLTPVFARFRADPRFAKFCVKLGVHPPTGS